MSSSQYTKPGIEYKLRSQDSVCMNHFCSVVWTPVYTVGGIGIDSPSSGFFSDEELFSKCGLITAIRGWTDYYLSG